jgi:nicotinate-nucleotide adenylyltransferase
MNRERIGIFGGTFNPIHKGHVKAAKEVQKVFQLEKILFIPSYIPPHKMSPDIASPSHRMKMVELAISSFPRFVPSSIEIDAGGKSYSILTLAKLKEKFLDTSMFFILGVDAFLEIETWRDHEVVLEQCHFVVISRPGYRLKDAEKSLGEEYIKRMVWVSDSYRFKEKQNGGHNIFFLSISALNIASKDVRERVREGKYIGDLVAKPVGEYIRQNKLYQRGK